MNARTDKLETARRIAQLAECNTLAAERDNAIIQRDQARREKMALTTQVRLLTAELAEARTLARSA